MRTTGLFLLRRLGPLLLLLSFCQITWAQVISDSNRLILQNGQYEMLLPEVPSEPDLLALFDTLDDKQKETFYRNRQYMLQHFANGLATPGVGQYLRWSKDQILTGVRKGRSLLRKSLSHLNIITENPDPIEPTQDLKDLTEVELKFSKHPEDLSPSGKAYLENAVSAMVANMWANSPGIAKSSGIGLSFTSGVVWNTHFKNKGMMFGRSLAVDIGVNFLNKEGYVRFYYDKESLSRGGLAFDIGLTMNTMLHFTDTDFEKGEIIEVTHQKLPPVGNYRRSERYNAMGAQFGLHIGDMVGMVLASSGVPQGLMLIPAVRYLGFVTFYKSSLQRRTLGQITLRKNHPLLKMLNLKSGLPDDKGAVLCREIYSAPLAL